MSISSAKGDTGEMSSSIKEQVAEKMRYWSSLAKEGKLDISNHIAFEDAMESDEFDDDVNRGSYDTLIEGIEGTLDDGTTGNREPRSEDLSSNKHAIVGDNSKAEVMIKAKEMIPKAKESKLRVPSTQQSSGLNKTHTC